MTKGCTVWFTGLTAAGKTTVSQIVAERLRDRGCKVEVLDGDEVRLNLSDGLGFTREDRDRNIRRIGYVCKLLTRNGVVAIAAAISPYRETREALRREIGDFVEVHVDCPLETCEERDYKGLYRGARAGKIQHVAGLSDPYEPPTAPDVLLKTHCDPPEVCADKVVAVLEEMGYVRPRRGAKPSTAEEGATPASSRSF